MKFLFSIVSLLLTSCVGYVQPSLGYRAPVYVTPNYYPGYNYNYGYFGYYGYQPGVQFNFGGNHGGYHHGHRGW